MCIYLEDLSYFFSVYVCMYVCMYIYIHRFIYKLRHLSRKLLVWEFRLVPHGEPGITGSGGGCQFWPVFALPREAFSGYILACYLGVILEGFWGALGGSWGMLGGSWRGLGGMLEVLV